MVKKKLTFKEEFDERQERIKNGEEDVEIIKLPKRKHKESNDEEKTTIVHTSFFEKNGIMFEQILTKDKKNKFISFNSATNETKLINEFKYDDMCYYKPLEGQEIIDNHIYLPSRIEEYNSDDELDEQIKIFIKKWLDISEDFLQYCIWEIKQSWIYDRLNTINYLRSLGDTGQGKTRALRSVGYLHYKPIITSGASTVAPIFRIIAKWKGTLLLDEFDLKNSDESADLIKVLNLGYEKGNPIIRCEQNNIDNVQFFDPYCPKVIATRKPFQDKATESRCFTTTMEGTDRSDMPPVLDKEFYDEAQSIRNKLLLWRFRNYNKINIEAYKNIDLGDLEPRIKQTHLGLLPLFAHQPDKLEFFKEYLQKLQKRIVNDRQDSFEGKIVKAFCELVFELKYIDVMPMDLIKQGEFLDFTKNPAIPMKPQKLSKWLKAFGLGEREDAKLIDGKTITPIKYTENQLKKLSKRYGYDEYII